MDAYRNKELRDYIYKLILEAEKEIEQRERRDGMSIGRKKAIRLKCLDCVCGQANEVRLCPAKDCPLWTWRMGYEVDLETGERVKSRKNKEEGDDE